LLQVSKACGISKRTIWRYKEKDPSIIKSLKENSKFGDTYLLDFDDVVSILEEWNRGRTTDRKSVDEVLISLYEIAASEPTMYDNIWSKLPNMIDIFSQIHNETNNENQDAFVNSIFNDTTEYIDRPEQSNTKVYNQEILIDELKEEVLKLKNENADLKIENAEYQLKLVAMAALQTEKDRLALENEKQKRDREKFDQEQLLKITELNQAIEKKNNEINEKDTLLNERDTQIANYDNMKFFQRVSFAFFGKKQAK
jgi:hypothetical protein